MVTKKIPKKKVTKKKLQKKIPKKIKVLCKRYRIRLSVKRGKKRVNKSLCVLLKQLKKKMKGTKRLRKSRFGEEDLSIEGNAATLNERPKKKNIFKRVGGAVRRNPVKSSLAALAIVGGAAVMAASGGALGGPAQLLISGALKSASGSVGKLSGQLGKMGDKVAENAKKVVAAAPNPAEALQKVQDTQQIVQTSKNLVGPLIQHGEQQTVDAVQTAAETGEVKDIPVAATKESEAEAKMVAQLDATVEPAAFGRRSRFGRSRFGHYSVVPYATNGGFSSQQVYNFGNRKGKMSKAMAMKIIRNLYRKNCKR